MTRRALTESQIEDFRDALCASATRMFAEQGYEGVTMRALAADLGCSPMTPYRYFKNKSEIFHAIRAAAAERFAEAIEEAGRGHSCHVDRLCGMGRGYVDFALSEPHAYRIMFELQNRPILCAVEEDQAVNMNGWEVMHAAVVSAVMNGELEGDPTILAHLFWSGIHGLVNLEHSGMLVLGKNLEELIEAFLERELSGPGRTVHIPAPIHG